MFRYKFQLPSEYGCVRYGVPQAEALTVGLEPNMAYFISGSHIFSVLHPVFDESGLSLIDNESPIVDLQAVYVASFAHPIQSLCCIAFAEEGIGYLCGIDERGIIKLFKSDLIKNLTLVKEFTHKTDSSRNLEESWCLLRFSPSGKRLLSIHGLSSTANIFDMNTLSEPIIINAADHPRSACWRDDDTVVITEHRQLAQYYISTSRNCTLSSRVNVGTNDISTVCAFTTSDSIVACTVSDRGVFGLNSRGLKIVKRWKAPIRNMVVGCVSERTMSTVYKEEIEVVYLCGDDNEVLFFKSSGREEKESALKERHSINIRSRSRIIGFSLCQYHGYSYLYILGQNGDLDVVKKPCEYLMERRKRRLNDVEVGEEKRAMVDD